MSRIKRVGLVIFLGFRVRVLFIVGSQVHGPYTVKVMERIKFHWFRRIFAQDYWFKPQSTWANWAIISIIDYLAGEQLASRITHASLDWPSISAQGATRNHRLALGQWHTPYYPSRRNGVCGRGLGESRCAYVASLALKHGVNIFMLRIVENFIAWLIKLFCWLFNVFSTFFSVI